MTTSRINPCPICHGTKSNCRNKYTKYDLPFNYLEDYQYFCMYLRGDIPGYKYTGETKNQLWGKFISSDLSEELSTIWRRDGQNIKRTKSNKQVRLRPKSKENNYNHLLSIEDRDRELRILLNQLKLQNYHKISLARRGFGQKEIDYYQFKTINFQQKLTIPVNNRLAGIAHRGLNLTNKYTGILIPITNHLNQYQGWQCRLDQNLDPRYLWAKTEGEKLIYSSHLKESGELPLSFTKPIVKSIDSDYIGIIEGIGFKAALTANKYQQVIIGASGGLFASSPQQLKLFLKEASKLTKSNKVLLYPDAGAVQNHLILIQYQRGAELIIKLNYELEVAWWGQITKAQLDIDEYQGNYEIIDIQSFFSISKKFSKRFR